jgi:hypothetical protein
MRRLLAVAIFSVATNASAQLMSPLDFVTLAFTGVRLYFSEAVPKEMTVSSSGTGKTKEEAVNNALLNAVQESIGVLVVSDQTAENNKVVRNLAAMYSSGMVNSYEVKRCSGELTVTCQVKAVVSPWSFQRKLLGNSKTIVINGNDLQGQHMTARNALIQRYKLTEYYLSQIQQSGLEVKIIEVKVLPSMKDNATVQIDYEVQWNKQFKKDVIAFLTKLEKDTNGQKENNHQVYIQWGPTGFFDNRVYINTYDAGFKSMMLSYLDQPIRVRVDELNTCEEFESAGGIFGVDWYGFRKQKTVEVSPNQLRRISSLSMSLGCRPGKLL